MESMYIDANTAIGHVRHSGLAPNPENVADETERFLSDWIELCTRNDEFVYILFTASMIGHATADAVIYVTDTHTGWRGPITPTGSEDTYTALSFWTMLRYVYKHPSTAAFRDSRQTRYFLREWARLCADADDDRMVTMVTPLKSANGKYVVWDADTRLYVNLDYTTPPDQDNARAIAAARDLFQRARRCAEKTGTT